MRRRVLELLRKLLSASERLDRANPVLLRAIPPSVKRRGLRAAFRLAAPLLPRVVTVAGVRLTAPRTHLLGYLLRPHEPSTVAVMNRFLVPGDTAVDVGANIGYLTLQMARRVGSEGRVVAIEPAPEILAWLRRNVEENDFHHVDVLPVAAGRTAGLRTLHLLGSTRHSFFSPPQASSDHVQVTAARLDDLVEDPVALVKIDVEGAELDVLRGMDRLLRQQPGPIVILEWNPECLAAADLPPDSVSRYLRNAGYSVYRITESGELGDFDPKAVPSGGYCNLCALPADGSTTAAATDSDRSAAQGPASP